MPVIMGIDPGSLRTGFGVVKTTNGRADHIVHGVIMLDEKSLSDRLQALSETLRELFDRHRPQHCVVEKIFLGKNADSAFKLGHARGVVLAEAARAKSLIFEYATRSVKKGVTGHGGADKEQVSLAVRAQLQLQKLVNYDASDALALALHHSQRNVAAAAFEAMVDR